MTPVPGFPRSPPASALEDDLARPVHVWEVMSTELVTAVPDEFVSDVHQRARRADVHHVIVVHPTGILMGILCGCDMERVWPDARVGAAMTGRSLFIGPGVRLVEAAETMERYGVGALPVLALDGRQLGVVTRSDLRRHGVLPGLRGVDRCASCGATHGLCPREVGEICFCRACEEAARRSTEDDLVGGGD